MSSTYRLEEHVETESEDSAENKTDFSAEEEHLSGDDDMKPHTSPAKGISQTMLEKFQELQKRREEAAKEKIPEYKKGKRKRKRKHKRDPNSSSSSKGEDDEEEVRKKVAHWDNLKQYIGVNDHMKGVSHDRLIPTSGLEKEINKAISEGDISKAEDLSDRLEKRDLAEKVSQAIDAREYMARKKIQDEEKKAKKGKKNKPAWTFEAKERWEMKAAM
ncbi:protein FAM204A-like isoform X2 [Saccoglossus kowalevskii]